jgi:ureidoglycolate hydrolase
MKKYLLLLSIFYTVIASAQPPQGVNYQAVVRNSAGAILPNAHVSVRFSIHDLSPTGTIVFQETHAQATNQFGLFNAVIGTAGSSLAAVNWGTGAKYLQVEIDVAGGTNYVDMGTYTALECAICAICRQCL